MSKLLEWLKAACIALGVRLDEPYSLNLGSGRVVHALARIHGMGDVNGVLIVRSYGEVRDLLNELKLAGYGFSVLDEPGPSEEFDLDSYREMFADWGWHKN